MLSMDCLDLSLPGSGHLKVLGSFPSSMPCAPCPAPLWASPPSLIICLKVLKDGDPHAAKQFEYPPSALSQLLHTIPPKLVTLWSMDTAWLHHPPFTPSLSAATCPSFGSALVLLRRCPISQNKVCSPPPMDASNLLMTNEAPWWPVTPSLDQWSLGRVGSEQMSICCSSSCWIKTQLPQRFCSSILSSGSSRGTETRLEQPPAV